MSGPNGPRPDGTRYKRRWRWDIGYYVLEKYCNRYGLTPEQLYDLVGDNSIFSQSIGNLPETYEVLLTIQRGVTTLPFASRLVRRNNGGFSIIGDVASSERANKDIDLEILKKSLERPSPIDYIKSVVKQARNPKNIEKRMLENSYFQPWGTSSDGNMNRRTERAVDVTLGVLDVIGSYNIGEKRSIPKLIIMPADYYAIDIDGWDTGIVTQFIEQLTSYVEDIEDNYKVDVKIKPYSEIIREERERYQEIKSSIEIPEIDPRKVFGAERWAQGNSEEAARDYTIERLTEGILIDEVFRPIKISLGSFEKDDCDGPLPVIYLRDTPVFPWIVSKWEDGS